MRQIAGKDWGWQEVPIAPGTRFTTLHESYTAKALEYFDRGDIYELEGHRDWALWCDKKALRCLEASFQYRNGMWTNRYLHRGPVRAVGQSEASWRRMPDA